MRGGVVGGGVGCQGGAGEGLHRERVVSPQAVSPRPTRLGSRLGWCGHAPRGWGRAPEAAGETAQAPGPSDRSNFSFNVSTFEEDCQVARTEELKLS